MAGPTPALDASMTAIGKYLMARGDLELGVNTLTLALVTDTSISPATPVLADYAAIAATGNYPAPGIDLTSMSLGINMDHSISVFAGNVILVGISTAFRNAAIYLAGHFGDELGGSGFTNPIVAVIDFGGVVTVSGDYTITLPGGVLISIV